MKEALLDLAKELEEYTGGTCEECAAYEQPECRGYLSCSEIVAKYCARRVRDIASKDERQAEEVFEHGPVLDAGGVEIKQGDTVWAVGDALTSMQVLEVKPSDDPDEPEHLVWCGETWGESLNYAKKWRIAGQLTHEQPDDWKRWREDLELSPVEYTDRYRVGRIGYEELDTYRDLVRRAKKLAKRGA